MMSRRLHAAGLAAVIAAALVTGGSGGGVPASHGDASKSTAPHVVANATLGSARFFPWYDHNKGFGSPNPTEINNGGDPVGLARGSDGGNGAHRRPPARD